MKWTPQEVRRLGPILEAVETSLGPVEAGEVLVLCSAGGEVAVRLAWRMTEGHVTGLELDDALLARSRALAEAEGVADRVSFGKAEMARIPRPDGAFDGLVSECIVFPTPNPTTIGQPEMARVLKPDGRIVLTDVLVTRPVPEDAREALRTVGLDYLCEGTPEDFRRWMTQAGLVDVDVADLTPIVARVWRDRRDAGGARGRARGYSLLLDPGSEYGLGRAIIYIRASGRKPGSGATGGPIGSAGPRACP